MKNNEEKNSTDSTFFDFIRAENPETVFKTLQKEDDYFVALMLSCVSESLASSLFSMFVGIFTVKEPGKNDPGGDDGEILPGLLVGVIVIADGDLHGSLPAVQSDRSPPRSRDPAHDRIGCEQVLDSVPVIEINRGGLIRAGDIDAELGQEPIQPGKSVFCELLIVSVVATVADRVRLIIGVRQSGVKLDCDAGCR